MERQTCKSKRRQRITGVVRHKKSLHLLLGPRGNSVTEEMMPELSLILSGEWLFAICTGKKRRSRQKKVGQSLKA